MANLTKIGAKTSDKTFTVQVVDDATGAVVSSWGSVSLKLGAAPGSVVAGTFITMGKEIKLRETVGCDPTTGDPRYCVMLRSEWYVTALTSDPET